MKRIVVSVTNDLITDQRVEKVCDTLYKNGFDILLIGRRFKTSEPIKRAYKTKRFKLFFNSGFLFYAEYNIRLFLYLFFVKKYLLLANDLDTLLANYLISKLLRKKIVFDCHELFPEIPELVNRKRTKNIWLFLEKKLLPKIKNKYTVCESIANFYKEKYQTNFTVIKNLPRKKDIEKGAFSFDTDTKKIILYQGATNIGRGLDFMIEAMKYLENQLFIIVGYGDIYHQLKEKVTKDKLEHKVFFLGRMTPQELHKITPLANLGISLEEDLGLNYRFALPNKIFDYIQAEVPILVSDLPEMKKIIQDFEVGEVLEERTPKKLANQIKNLLNKDFNQQLKRAKEVLVWEEQEQTLLSIFGK